MRKRKKLYFPVFLAIIFAFLLGFFFIDLNEQTSKSAHPLQQGAHEYKENTLAYKTVSKQITLGAIGDILIHDTVYKDARIKNGYDFKPMLKDVRPLLLQPDLLLANLETIVGGEKIGLSSYPRFNSPHEVADAFKDAGVDIVSTANNHLLDKGEKGLIASLDYLDKINLPHVGTYRSKEEQQTLTILEKNGIKVAYLAYTYGTNGIPVPKGKEYLVNLIDREKMKEEIVRARNQADVVVMSIHWGIEYQRYPSNEQKKLGQYLIDSGVDIIFGHHPHVLQPMEWVKAKDGRNGLIVYSLGNFLSGQKRDYKDIGGMVTVDVTKTINENGTTIALSNPRFFPTYVTSRFSRNYRVVPLQDAERHGLKNAGDIYLEIMNHMTGALNK